MTRFSVERKRILVGPVPAYRVEQDSQALKRAGVDNFPVYLVDENIQVILPEINTALMLPVVMV